MQLHVVRVEEILPGVEIFVDDQPDGFVVWVRADVMTEAAAHLLEAALNLSIMYWRRCARGAGARGGLRAV